VLQNFLLECINGRETCKMVGRIYFILIWGKEEFCCLRIGLRDEFFYPSGFLEAANFSNLVLVIIMYIQTYSVFCAFVPTLTLLTGRPISPLTQLRPSVFYTLIDRFSLNSLWTLCRLRHLFGHSDVQLAVNTADMSAILICELWKAR
jgi:hypothetical protein